MRTIREKAYFHAGAFFVVVLSLSLTAAPAARQDAGSDKPPRKGDRVVVRGCISGPLLEGIEATRQTPAFPPGLTFRLSGDKSLLKKMRNEENGRKVEISGVLKSDLRQDGTPGKQVGKTRIVVGVGTTDTMQQQAPPHRPVIEVKSYEPLAVACGG